MTRRLSLLVAALLFFAGCSSEATPTSPSLSSASPGGSGAGSWRGSVNDPVMGEGTASLVLVEQTPGPNGSPTQGALAGTWAFAFRSGDTVTGQAEGDLGNTNSFGLILTVEPLQGCQTRPGSSALVHYQLTNAVVTSSRITAVLNRITCATPSVGTVSLIRQ
jgi:hypothetical protein